MKFSSVSDKQGIIQDCESVLFGDSGYGKISGDTNMLATFVRNSNRALDRTTALIFGADGRWQWDDSNYDEYPFATANLVSAKSDYRFDVTHLKIHEVHIRNPEDTAWIKLESIDPTDFPKPLAETFGSGTPRYYDKISDALFLYPSPNYAITSGLKVIFQQQASHFTASDTTKEPGFANIFHRLIPLWASYDYAFAKQLSIAKVLRDEIVIMEKELEDFYSQRSKDEHITLKVRRSNFR